MTEPKRFLVVLALALTVLSLIWPRVPLAVAVIFLAVAELL